MSTQTVKEEEIKSLASQMLEVAEDFKAFTDKSSVHHLLADQIGDVRRRLANVLAEAILKQSQVNPGRKISREDHYVLAFSPLYMSDGLVCYFDRIPLGVRER